jgi:hypothetical protein
MIVTQQRRGQFLGLASLAGVVEDIDEEASGVQIDAAVI